MFSTYDKKYVLVENEANEFNVRIANVFMWSNKNLGKSSTDCQHELEKDLFFLLCWSDGQTLGKAHKNTTPYVVFLNQHPSARAGEIAQLNRFMPHSKDKKNTGKSIIDQVCGMVRFPRNFR